MIKILRKILAFSGNQKKNFIVGVLFSFLNSMFKMCYIVAIAFVLKHIIADTVSQTVVWQIFLIIVCGIVGMVVTTCLMGAPMTIGGYTLAADSRIHIADRLKNMSMGYFNANNLGKITTTATNSAELLSELLTRCRMLVSQGYFMAIVITASLFYFDYRMGILCSLGILSYGIITAIQQRITVKHSKAIIKDTQSLVDTILEYVQGIAVVKSYNLVGTANKKVKNRITSARDMQFGMETTFMPIMIVQSLLFKVVSCAMLVLSIVFFINGSMSLFNAIMMCICSFMVFADLEMSMMIASMRRIVEGSINEINGVLNAPVMDDSATHPISDDYNIEVNDVDFSYHKRKIIDNLSVSIPQGSTLAIVGGSGSGKTTLCNLITRFWDVDSGEILLGGKNIKEFKLDELLSKFSMVFQRVYLFNDTIANNVKFGFPNATKEQVEDACKKACCHDFIMNLENGYDTIIGEGGATISGGEKQRISIARAILKDSPIVILDEATANVDPENELQLQSAIQELTKSKTVIMIAHRLKTVEHADNIIVLDKGKIAESGKHEALLEQGGIYANFVQMRQKAIGWKLGRRGNM